MISQIAVDPAGNLFIADTYNHRVRRVDAVTGIITTVAGDAPYILGAPPSDGEQATAVSLDIVTGVAVDANGQLFVGENDGHVFKVDLSTGEITNVCTTGGSPQH